MRSLSVAGFIAGFVTLLSSAATAQIRPSISDSFRLGEEGAALCQVQMRPADPALESIFDRGYAIVCRDAAEPVGQVYALRDADSAEARLAARRAEGAACEAPAAATLEDLGQVRRIGCRLNNRNIGYTVYQWQSGDTLYVAQGLAGYDSALRLALRSVALDRVVPGEVEIATTEAGDPAAFAAAQAGTLDEGQALTEAYRRNNAGNYAEAAEFFETLISRSYEEGETANSERVGEFLINQALQYSNLGRFEEAEAIYRRALSIPSASPTQLRLRRNFRTLHLMNQRRFEEALAVVDAPLEESLKPADDITAAVISEDTASEINSSDDLSRRLGGETSERLTETERAVILDAQARQLRGTLLRVLGRPDEARTALESALAAIASVRNGRVRSTARLRAQALTELALLAEDAGDQGTARNRLTEAMALMETQYPSAVATSAAKARYAGYLARRGERREALRLFAEVVEENSNQASPRAGLENRLAPYLELLLDEMVSDPGVIDQFFLATETLVRPGVANTQAVLARELAGGNDEASRLFRESVNLSRAIDSARVELARLQALEDADADVAGRIAALQTQLDDLAAQQTEIQAELGQFPRYRAISTNALTLADLQATLRPDEAYLKLADVAGRIYAILITPDEATAYRADLSSEDLTMSVQLLRETISFEEKGKLLTYPFDVGLAYTLYRQLLGPVADRLATARHLIFEPDGAMLQLPLNLLITEEAGVAAYERRVGMPDIDPFDFTGVAWLGRTTEISTAVSARSFRDLRNLAPSSAPRQYLGLGENVRPGETARDAGRPGEYCSWPLAVWQAPISAAELVTASSIIGQGRSELVTGADFTDTAIEQRGDLDQFRILHFATHGLVTQPRPECPPHPALLTSFGSGDSDGLLSFAEIFDLRLDADLVILSACDTASAAGIAASREAGISGGTSALDGLVRAFVGAGSRVVVASHWPAPDDYDATRRLMTGLFEGAAGNPITGALRGAQIALMDDPATSHPYYWAGFAVIGDGTRPVVQAD
ncbi:MAG: CHAT domain-containing protein [Sphingomonadales bacterium]|nr:CHAT domain-containing protein [Sphingomonadales bacterium]